jgi:hypothetical protein
MVAVLALALLPLLGCSHTVGDCSHINDVRALPRPATLVMARPEGGTGHGLDAGVVYMVQPQLSSADLVVIWRACPVLNHLTAVETSSSVTVDVGVSGCPSGYWGTTEPPPTGDTWFGGVVHLNAALGSRTVVSAATRFCDIVING